MLEDFDNINRSSKKYVPFTLVEWKRVQGYYLSNDKKELSAACEIISMWINRMGHKTPVVIGISELLFRAILLHKQVGQSAEMENVDKSLIYASVIIRFVNYVNDICQPEGVNSMLSIATAVQRMGIPSWIVNIRHQAAHGQVPPIQMLERAIKFCHHWLWEQHWSRPLNEALKEPLPKEVYERRLEALRVNTTFRICTSLDNFKEWREKVVYVSTKNEDINILKSRSPFREMNQFLDEFPEEFISILVECCLSKGGLVIRDSCLDSIQEVPFGRKYIGTVMLLEQSYYKPILEMLNNKDQLPSLLLEITNVISDSNNPILDRAKLSGWADILLTALLNSNSITDHMCKSILKSMILAPQFFDNKHFTSLMDRLKENFSKKCLTRLAKLLKIGEHQHLKHLTDNASSLHIFTLDELKYNISQREVSDVQIPRDMDRIEDWTTITTMADELGPMGLTADQSTETLDLELKMVQEIPLENLEK